MTRGKLELEGFKQQTGRLTVLKYLRVNGNQEAVWLCQCSCGNTCEHSSWRINTEQVKSCGCLTIENRRNKTQTWAAFGETKTLKDWSEDPRCIINHNALKTRVRNGWPIEIALTTVRRKFNSSNSKVKEKKKSPSLKELFTQQKSINTKVGLGASAN